MYYVYIIYQATMAINSSNKTTAHNNGMLIIVKRVFAIAIHHNLNKQPNRNDNNNSRARTHTHTSDQKSSPCVSTQAHRKTYSNIYAK